MSSVEMEGLWAARVAQHLRVGCCQALLPEYDPGTRKDRKERLLQVVLVSTHITCLLLPHQKHFFFLNEDLCYLKRGSYLRHTESLEKLGVTAELS